ncbi:MAG: hypothetical protein JO256_09120 [Alphaproteobacteria bacterium]|nr:hypothetical protein [Alphaproteobacteria bacterium]
MIVERGFCTDRQYLPALRTAGLTDKLIWLAGRGAETLDRCLSSFRGRPGRLYIAPDCRVFGDSRRDIAQVMAGLERAKIRVVDVIHPQHETISDLLTHAGNLIARGRFGRKRDARRRGARGGRVKAIAAEQRRAEIAADWFLRNLVQDSDIPWKALVRALDGKMSEATLRRNYGGEE